MLPHDRDDLKYDQRDGTRHDEVIYTERSGPGIGAVIAALVIAAAIIFGVWYLVAADETDDVNLPDEVDVTVDIDGAPGS